MFKSFLHRLRDSEFARNVLTLFSGSLLAQAIPFLATPLLTRLFPEDIFGIYFLYTSILAVVAVIATLKYELATVLPDSDTEAANLLALALGCAILVSLLSALFIWFAYERLITWFDLGQLGPWLYLLPLSIFLVGFGNAFSYWHNRHKQFGTISLAKIARSATIVSAQSATGLSPFQHAGLIPGLLAGQALQTLYLVRRALQDMLKLHKQITFKQMLKSARVYKDIPMFNTLIGFLNTLSNQLPVLLLSRFFGLASAAYYGLANRIIGVPSGLIGQSVGQVFYQQASEQHNRRDDLYAFVKRTYRRLLLIGLPLFLGLGTATFFFGFLFGQHWQMAGQYALILLPWLFIMFLNSPITFIITVLNRQKQMVVYDVFLLLARATALLTGYYLFNSAIYALAMYSLSGLFFNLLLMYYLLYISRRSQDE